MPVTPPMSLPDFFKTIGAAFDPAKVPGARTQTLPNGGGSYQTPTAAPDPSIRSIYGGNDQADYAGPTTAIPPLVAAPKGPVTGPAGPTGRTFQGGAAVPTGATGATGATGGTGPLDYSQYQDRINPDTGKLYTPQEYADHIASRAGGGTIPQYAGDSITKGPQSAEDLKATARGLNNSRNDIATGAKDPYGVASQSGIQYTPAELSAIEKAYSGVYDPALGDVFKKLDLKQKQDAADQAAKIAATKTQSDFENDLKKMAVKQGYDIQLKEIEAANSNPFTSKNQDKLEQEYRNILIKPLSNRSGGLGLEDQKVNQAIHLANLIKQYKQPDGTYNIPATQYNELALGLARLISPTGTVGAEVQNSVTQATAKGDFGKALTYITGTPVNGSTQDVYKNLIDTIDRQGQTSASNRDTYMQYLQGLAPTDLDPERSSALEKRFLNQYTPIVGLDSGSGIDSAWLSAPNYSDDIKQARDAISQGADPSAVKSRLLLKYKQVDL